jgi:GNAT superfamily N-acetyltransferase
MSTSATVVVRHAHRTDLAALKAILYDTFEATWRPNVSTADAEAFLAEDRSSAYVVQRGLDFWVAERDGEVVGLIHWEADFVHALHVRPRHAHTGVGSRLLDWAEADIARSGFAAARLETHSFNQVARAFYAARGYLEHDSYPDKEWNSGLTTLLLVKALT